MSFATDALARVQALADFGPLPRVRALHLPPLPAADAMRGEFAALELEDGSLGLSYVLLGDTWAGLRRHAQRHDLAGADALALARGCAGGDPVERTLGFAALNALTRRLFDQAGFVPPASADSLGALDPQPGETVGMVGYFTPLIPRIVARGARVLVVELRADLAGERDGVRVTLDAAELAGCAKVLATGTLLLNDTLDATLAHCRGARALALVGPSVGCPPDPLFARGITLLGGSWVTDGPGYLRALAAGESTQDLARKFSLAPRDYPGWEALLERAAVRRA
ncbi:Rossmann-like domain-containing protein [Azohydromonas aeria]|uniref:Rossmann-like domain-containing protein n=1 Tax=Azohydromonas aeria TaxID=2590212 RepID=UPI0012FA429F|nr:DUF364 domain-containing protein [Azohydromonas aeria]